MTTTHDAVTAEDGGEDWVTKLLRTVESQASSLGGETANGFSKLTKHTFLLPSRPSQASQGANCTPGTEINLGVEYLTFKEERFKAAALVS